MKRKKQKMLLKEIQNDFVNHIFDRKNDKIIKTLPYSSQEALARLNIYRNNVFGNFFAILESTFEVSKKIIGERKFKKLVEEYQKKYPANCGDLNEYPNNFPQILKKLKPEFLYDLARLELALHRSYYADDVKDFAIKNFSKIKPKDFYKLTFDLHPSCFLLESKFPIFTIFSKKKKIVSKKTEFVLIDRALGKCEISAVSQEEFLFLQHIAKKKNLFQTYKEIVKLNKEFDIGVVLNKFIHSRVICNFYSN